MYMRDEICYAGEMQEGIKVTEAKPLRGGMMLVTFSTRTPGFSAISNCVTRGPTVMFDT